TGPDARASDAKAAITKRRVNRPTMRDLLGDVVQQTYRRIGAKASIVIFHREYRAAVLRLKSGAEVTPGDRHSPLRFGMSFAPTGREHQNRLQGRGRKPTPESNSASQPICL
ncbi:MAG: hypothetical protein P3W94_004955, partial [Paracoccus sp. (in: a-proteobacteria)]|nr:hypothetical protein [Paracoccus sp. (in: a-proteobacteria)]